MERVLMLIAWDWTLAFDYADGQAQCARRRRMAEVHPDKGGNGVIAAAVNASYIVLAGRVEISEPVDFRL